MAVKTPRNEVWNSDLLWEEVDENCNRKEVEMFDWLIDIIRDMQKDLREVRKIRDRKSKKRK